MLAKFFDSETGQHLATAEVEVVPTGTYIIDGVEYRLERDNKPVFHINKIRSGGGVIMVSDGSHLLESVDLKVTKPSPRIPFVDAWEDA